MLSKYLHIMILFLLTAVGSLKADEPELDDGTKMHGIWVAEKVTSSGREVPSAKFPFELHFERSKLTFKFVGKTKGEDRVHDIAIDSSKTPSTIDITREIRGKVVTVRGIYKFEDGKLIICSLRGPDRQPSSERPTSFESSRAITSELMVLKPKPAADE